ncbi:MAG: PD-(D/E)XK nuclease family transposase [Eubacteriales bacterium]
MQEVKSQYSIRQLETRSVILDIYAVEEGGTRLTLEMHPRADENYLRRNQYNIGSIDMNLLDKGVKYEQLPEIYAIYLSKKKFAASNAAIKEVARVYIDILDVRAGTADADNGIHEYCVNLGGTASTKEQRELLRYLVDDNGRVESNVFPNLVRRVRILKEEQGGIEIMCEIMDELMGMSKEQERVVVAEKMEQERVVIAEKMEQERIIAEQKIKQERKQFVENWFQSQTNN